MIDRSHEHSVTRQAKLVGISRGTVYYLSQPVAEADLVLMRRIDELHLEYPWAAPSDRFFGGVLEAGSQPPNKSALAVPVGSSLP